MGKLIQLSNKSRQTLFKHPEVKHANKRIKIREVNYYICKL